MAYDGIWWHMMAYGGISWHMTAYDGIWWHMMAFDLIARKKYIPFLFTIATVGSANLRSFC